jgi:hypothetical protein
MSYPVKWFHSDMVGAPQLQINGGNLLPGTLISVLDACLLNGFNTQGLDSLTYNSGTNEAIGTVAAGHGFLKYQVILIEGANEPAFNGEQRVTFVDATTFKFTPTQTPPATATGTITAKAAPLGWAKPFSGTNKAVYQSTDPLSTGFYLRVDDTTTTKAKAVSGYESMTDVDTGTNPFGSSGFFSLTNQTAFYKWAIVGDGRLFYIYSMGSGLSQQSGQSAFGDINSFKPADGYHCVLIPNTTNPNSYASASDLLRYMNATYSGRRIARQYDGVTLNPVVNLYGSKASLYANPNPADGQFYINESPIIVDDSGSVRGTLPGLCIAYNTLDIGFNIIDNASNSTDVFLVLLVQENSVKLSQSAFNLTGAWR